ncbi:Hypothetical predicted protein, partial [Olea europaea subsp. europaea]
QAASLGVAINTFNGCALAFKLGKVALFPSIPRTRRDSSGWFDSVGCWVAACASSLYDFLPV